MACLAGVLATAGPAVAQSGQSNAEWSFENDAFTELWYHGLAVVGYYGFGPMPLYDPGYVLEARAQRVAAGLGPTSLEEARGQLLRSLQADEAFEVLHFLPAYFYGAGVTASLEALKAVADTPSGPPRVLDPAVSLGTQVAAQVLLRGDQREVLGTFVRALEQEWAQVVGPRLTRESEVRSQRLQVLTRRWQVDYATPLAGFLENEELGQGAAILASGLGAEGRFVPSSGSIARQTVVALTMPTEVGQADAVLSSLVRELCYPAVRRAFEPFQTRFRDRVEASRASDLAATRCGELLLEHNAPSQLAAYRSRFDVPSTGTGRAFLSASGITGAAAFEAELNESLERELNIHRDGARADALPVGRN